MPPTHTHQYLMNNKLYEDETWPAGTAMLYGNSNVIKNC